MSSKNTKWTKRASNALEAFESDRKEDRIKKLNRLYKQTDKVQKMKI